MWDTIRILKSSTVVHIQRTGARFDRFRSATQEASANPAELVILDSSSDFQ